MNNNDDTIGKASTPVQSVSRAISILRCFADKPEIGVSELARLAGLHKSTAAGIINTLKIEGILETNEDNGKLRLGTELFRISANAKKELRAASRPFMNTLLLQTGETISLAARSGNMIVFLDQRESGHSMKFSTRLGGSYPFYCTGNGKAIFAFLPEEEVRNAYFSSDLIRYTKNTCTSYDELKSCLSIIRENGYAFDRCEWEDGLVAIAAPVFSRTGKPIAAISISGPSIRITPERMTELTPYVIEAARGISESLQ